MNNLTGAARRVTRNFDQFSVICVFGSVVGCVVLPLMIQSMESFIITFLVLCLTAKPLRGRLFPSGNQAQDNDRRRSRDKDENKKSKKSSTKKKPVQVVGSGEQMQHFREEDLEKQEQQRLEDRERRLEEKREKKARKKEERHQRKEGEKKEKERDEQFRRERQEARLLKKKEEKERKQKMASFDIPTRENIQAIVNATKPLKRERKHSTSSSASSISAHSTSCHPPRFQHHSNRQSHRHAAPFRASSDPEISVTTRTSPASVGKSWQPTPPTLPSAHGSSHWYTDIANRTFPNIPVMTSSTAARSQPLLFPQAGFYTVYPATTPFQQQATAMPGHSNTSWTAVPTTSTATCAGNNHSTQVGEPLQHLFPQAGWLPVSSVSGGHNPVQGGNARNFSPAPGTGTGTGMAQQFNRLTGAGYSSGAHTLSTASSLYDNGSLVNSGFGTRNTAGNNFYSLFSSSTGGNDGTPFSAVGGLLNLDTSTDHMRHQAVSTGSPLSVNSDLSDGGHSSLDGSLQRNPSGSSSPLLRNGHQYQSVESIGSATAANRSFDEWPNI